jgi:hypothetical protein
MNFEDINFPVYRRYKNGKTYFKIISPDLFEELQIIGKRKKINKVQAKFFPERTFIYELVFNYAEMADEISELEYKKAGE